MLLDDATALWVGSLSVTAVYVGTTLVWIRPAT